MRIGLLECDHVAERYLPIAGDYGDMFGRWWRDADPDAEVVRYDAHRGVLPERPDECDAWLCTGSSASVYDDEPWIDGLADFVRAVHVARVPLVGVCFGHQLLAHALGGRTERADGRMGRWSTADGDHAARSLDGTAAGFGHAALQPPGPGHRAAAGRSRCSPRPPTAPSPCCRRRRHRRDPGPPRVRQPRTSGRCSTIGWTGSARSRRRPLSSRSTSRPTSGPSGRGSPRSSAPASADQRVCFQRLK